LGKADGEMLCLKLLTTFSGHQNKTSCT